MKRKIFCLAGIFCNKLLTSGLTGKSEWRKRLLLADVNKAVLPSTVLSKIFFFFLSLLCSFLSFTKVFFLILFFHSCRFFKNSDTFIFIFTLNFFFYLSPHILFFFTHLSIHLLSLLQRMKRERSFFLYSSFFQIFNLFCFSFFQLFSFFFSFALFLSLISAFLSPTHMFSLYLLFSFHSFPILFYFSLSFFFLVFIHFRLTLFFLLFFHSLKKKIFLFFSISFFFLSLSVFFSLFLICPWFCFILPSLFFF